MDVTAGIPEENRFAQIAIPARICPASSNQRSAARRLSCSISNRSSQSPSPGRSAQGRCTPRARDTNPHALAAIRSASPLAPAAHARTGVPSPTDGSASPRPAHPSARVTSPPTARGAREHPPGNLLTRTDGFRRSQVDTRPRRPPAAGARCARLRSGAHSSNPVSRAMSGAGVRSSAPVAKQRSASSRRTSNCGRERRFARAAASSSASGMPSSRRQMAMMAVRVHR